MASMRSTCDKIRHLAHFPKFKKKRRHIRGTYLEEESLETLWNKAHPEYEPYHLSSLCRAPEMAVIVWEMRQALAQGASPVENQEGTSESYFMKDREGDFIAVFKPFCHWSFDAKRELAAYRLDHGHFAGVPPTVVTSLSHPAIKGDRQGVLLLYIDAIPTVRMDLVDYQNFSPSQIRRIAMLDIRILNGDRHTSNLLYSQEGKGRLIPIDHGLTLTTTPFPASFVWLEWKASSLPFSKTELQYIDNLDPIEDAKMLMQEIGIEEIDAVYSLIATHCLKEGTKRGLTASQLGKMVLREQLDWKQRKSWLPSLVEKVYNKLKVCSFSGWRAYDKRARTEVARILDREISQCPKRKTARGI